MEAAGAALRFGFEESRLTEIVAHASFRELSITTHDGEARDVSR